MIAYEDECCGCVSPGYPCIGETCINKNVKHLYCDKCNADVEVLFIVDDKEICEDCLLENFSAITLDD